MENNNIEMLCEKVGFDFESFMYLVNYFNMSEPVVIAVLNYINSQKENSANRAR